MSNKTKVELEVEIEKLLKENEELREGRTGDPDEVADLKQHIAHLNAQLEQNVHEAETEAAGLRAEVDRLTSENARLDASNKEYATDNDKLASEAAVDGDMRNALNAEKAELRERADKAELEVAEQRDELDRLRKQNNDLRVKLETASVRGSTLHGHIDDLKTPY